MVSRSQGAVMFGIRGVVERIKGSSKDRKVRVKSTFGKASAMAAFGVEV